MSDLYNTRIKLKRDTEANWLSADPVLLDGEVAVVYTANGGTRKKTGDGTKKFSELPYDDRKNWLQNDSSAADYIEHRPGGYMTDPVITDADAFTITAAEEADGMYMADVAVESSSITLSDYAIGDGVIVDFGGKSYNLQWYALDFPACGATIAADGETIDWANAPFIIMALSGGEKNEQGEYVLAGYYVYLQNPVTSPIQVQIKKAKQTPVKIPLKYLESDLYVVKVTALSNEQRPGVAGAERSYDAAVSATYDDIVAAVGDGKTPILLGDVTALNLVEISTDTVDGAEPYMLFGGAYFDNDNRLYGTVVQINSDGTAILKKYDGQFVRRLKDIEEASSRSVGKVLIGTEDTDGYKWAAGDAVTSDSIAEALGYTPVDQKTLDDLQKQIGNLDNLTTEAKANLVAAISEAAESGGNGLLYANRAGEGVVPIVVNREGLLIWDYKKGITVPEATAANNGKIPQIVDGKWALANPPKLPDVSADDDGKLLGVTGGTWGKVDKPAALKNPNALTIKIGSATVTYDGSVAQSIEIEDGSEVSY